MDLERFLSSPPVLHEVAGAPASHGLTETALRWIERLVSSESRTLETGAGQSTVCFALKGAEHCCIEPDRALVERIQSYCATENISLRDVDFQIAPSETVLPKLSPRELDLVLIDGRHAFPAPFIDWHYTEEWLKVGGHLIVDDIHLKTGEILFDFLKAEPEWRLVEAALPRMALFKKMGEGSSKKWWGQQPYVNEQSELRFPRWRRWFWKRQRES